MASKANFEKSLQQLEQIVEELESGDLPLEKAFKKFEEGVKLSQSCAKKLDEIEQKITQLVEKQDGALTEQPLWDSDQTPSEDD